MNQHYEVVNFDLPVLIAGASVTPLSRAVDVNGEWWFRPLWSERWVPVTSTYNEEYEAPKLLVTQLMVPPDSEIKYEVEGELRSIKVLTTLEEVSELTFGSVVQGRDRELVYTRVPGGLRHLFDHDKTQLWECEPLLPLEVLYDSSNN